MSDGKMGKEKMFAKKNGNHFITSKIADINTTKRTTALGGWWSN